MAQANLIDINKLIKISTFAASYVKGDGSIGCSHPWVDKLAERGDVDIVHIDGVRFVQIK